MFEALQRGTPQGDLPVQSPTRFQLVINTKAAHSLGMTVPATLPIFWYLSASLGVVMPAGAYECRAASPDTPFAGQLAQTVPTSAPAVTGTNGNKKLRDAAEPFEKLTEK